MSGTFEEFSAEAIRLLDAPNFAHLSTLMPDGSPKVEPVWISRQDNDLLITTDAKALKARNLSRDPRVGISIVDFANPYEQLLVRGTVRETRPDDDLALMDELAMKYLGKPFPRRRWSERVVFVLRPHLVRHYRSPLVDPRTEPQPGPPPGN